MHPSDVIRVGIRNTVLNNIVTRYEYKMQMARKKRFETTPKPGLDTWNTEYMKPSLLEVQIRYMVLEF